MAEEKSIMDTTPAEVAAQLKAKEDVNISPERELIEKYKGKLFSISGRFHLKKRHWYVIIAWLTMTFNQLYAPAYDDWSVMWNIGAAVLWPLYWFSFSAFGVAHVIHAWFV